ncbi:MAG TPA: DEAD/DEAH box helicase [Candidatus Hydrogenedentes bacterium]|nr:DEAD/DEAH box helicase [Candidatus Hydrogenedentota bacterium]HPG69307.1 DEAD/DEAH box helicase [Candidatus Hydrogenedentota bacterium]
MKMLELIRYNIPPEVVQLWQERESDGLLPLQEMAIKRHDLFGKGNLIVQAPTSSGKTFIGEMAAIQAALRRKKVVYLVPLKALAEEKYRDFSEKYTPYGINVIISTRDRREFDQRLENGNFSIAVVVYEKLAQLLVRRPEQIEEIALVVADELEILSDPERGSMAELLLTRILYPHAGSPDAKLQNAVATDRPRVIGLSAVIGEADRLAEWMQAALVTYERRPVELRYGILHDGVFRYRTYNEFGEGEETLVGGASDAPSEVIAENVHRFVEQGEPCLIFVKSKHESRHGAELLAEQLSQPAAVNAIEALRKLEATRSRDALIRTLNSAVAFHNADLSPEERRVVEQAFRNEEIKVVVSTSTLAVGMNMPTRNVFITPEKWRYDSRFGMPWKTPILHAEYENMGGRAGRYGAGHDFGRAIVLASTPFDQEALWRRYIEGEREHVEPQLARLPLENPILQLVASRTCLTEAALFDFLEHTLTGRWVWSVSLTKEECEFRIRAAVNRAVDAGAISRHPHEDSLEATPFGKAIAAKGVTIAAASELERWIAESETRHWSALDLILAAAMTTDGRMLPVSLTAREYEQADYPARLKRVTENEEITADVPLNRLRNCDMMPFFEEVRAIKTALLLNEWIEHVSIRDIEDAYHTMAGQILAAADHLSWLIDATATLATTLGAHGDFVDRINALAWRVQAGLRDEALPLARAVAGRLPRTTILTLVAHHLDTPEVIVEAPIAALTRWMPAAEARRIQAWARRATSDTETADSSPPPPVVPVLIVDDGRPGEIGLDGVVIALQDKQYRLIRVLAAHPGECVPYETIYRAVWGDSIVEPNQMHFQKRRLLNAITAQFPQYENLITTKPKCGFMLNLTPEQIALPVHEMSYVA